MRNLEMRLKTAYRAWRYGPYPYRPHEVAYGIIFVHIPKCAGTSILSAFGVSGRGRRHVEYGHYLRADAERFSSYFKFAVIRDPVDRLRSCYDYLAAGGNGTAEDRVLTDRIVSESDGFESFVLDVLSPSLLAGCELFKPQSAFICDRSGRVRVDQVLRFENLEEDYEGLRARFPVLPPALPRENKFGQRTERPVSAAVQERIADFYQSDYEYLFNRSSRLSQSVIGGEKSELSDG